MSWLVASDFPSHFSPTTTLIWSIDKSFGSKVCFISFFLVTENRTQIIHSETLNRAMQKSLREIKEVNPLLILKTQALGETLNFFEQTTS